MSQTKPLSARQPLEEQIIRLLATKSQAAITLIYEGYGGALYHVILKIVGQAELAQEVLQDSLIKIWQNSTQYDAGKARLFTWMVQICRNAAIDARRSRRFKEGEKTKELPDFVSNVERFSESQRQGDPALRAVLQRLPEQDQRIIELLYFQEFTQQEASEALGMPLGSVKTRVRGAIKQLRAILGDEGLLSSAAVVQLIQFLLERH